MRNFADDHTNLLKAWMGWRLRNVRFRWAAQPVTEAEYEYRVVRDMGLTALKPRLAARYPNADLGAQASFVQRRSLRPRQEAHVTLGTIAVGVGVPLAGWLLWQDGYELLGLFIAVLGLVLATLVFLFPTSYWEVSPGTPLRLAEAALSMAEPPGHPSPGMRTQAVPRERWFELDLVTVS